MNEYPINEIFETIQGEASFTGTPSVFIRLQGCPVGCHWCDTKHTWHMTNKLIPIINMVKKTEDEDTYSKISVEEIMLLLKNYKAKHIVITGGEPSIYDLTKLTTAIINSNRTVQIETAGIKEIKAHKDSFITLSPKLDMAGGTEVYLDNFKRVNEIKFPVGKLADINKLKLKIIPNTSANQTIWLQPISQSKSATKLCIDQAISNGWKISLQTHKYMSIR